MQTTQLFNNHSILQYAVYTEWYTQYNVLYTVYLYSIQYTVCITLMAWTPKVLVKDGSPRTFLTWFRHDVGFYVLCCCLGTLHLSVRNAVLLNILHIDVCEENNSLLLSQR